MSARRLRVKMVASVKITWTSTHANVSVATKGIRVMLVSDIAARQLILLLLFWCGMETGESLNILKNLLCMLPCKLLK